MTEADWNACTNPTPMVTFLLKENPLRTTAHLTVEPALPLDIVERADVAPVSRPKAAAGSRSRSA